MGLEVVVMVLSLGILGVQLFAWRWAHLLSVELRGKPGGELVRLIELVIAGVTIARLIGIVGSLALGYTQITLGNALVLTTVTQFITAVVMIAAVWRIRQMSGEAPVDLPSEAVVELDAEPAAEVPLAPGDVGAAVDDGDGQAFVAPAKLD